MSAIAGERSLLSPSATLTWDRISGMLRSARNGVRLQINFRTSQTWPRTFRILTADGNVVCKVECKPHNGSSSFGVCLSLCVERRMGFRW
ncbi:hypothetical protein HAX54_023997 [Datura stramonium]|uniref:Uncharacterized protein n=1 Tax=Datura stramonium TaxID=4076 RepID=A0ABS8UX94_DATST|nr:hypothetical protein [Datura stramonium]